MSNPHDYLEIHPETLWHERLKFWPSAVLAELAIRIHGLLRERASHQEELQGDKDIHPEQKQQVDQA